MPDRTTPSSYRGRFAPTPSGPLHLGSLLTALASYLEAKSRGGAWLVRIDDLDTARCRPEYADLILEQLREHGLSWDEAPRLQSQHLAQYREALDRLHAGRRVYACECTRAVLASSASPGPDGPVYPGTCARKSLGWEGRALRFSLPGGTMTMDDPWQGLLQRNLASEVGDFVLRRADGIYGYQLACAVDEHEQGITDVVRGADLIASSFRQRCLLCALGFRQPGYRHLPVLTGPDGRKLSKQNHAAPISAGTAAENLYRALHLLKQAPPAELQRAAVPAVIAWATQHWCSNAVPHESDIPAASAL